MKLTKQIAGAALLAATLAAMAQTHYIPDPVSSGNFIGSGSGPHATPRPVAPKPPPTPAQIAAEKTRVLTAQTNVVRSLEASALAGSTSAQYSLGLHYLNGQGCATNRALALDWLKVAADGGDLNASNKLAALKGEK